MTEEEIKKGNKLIAEFMGYGFSDSYAWPPDGGRPIDPRELDYDCDWSLLMPVVEKIEKLPYTREGSLKNKEHYEKWELIKGALISVNINILWSTVIVFIKWYNQTK